MTFLPKWSSYDTVFFLFVFWRVETLRHQHHLPPQWRDGGSQPLLRRLVAPRTTRLDTPPHRTALFIQTADRALLLPPTAASKAEHLWPAPITPLGRHWRDCVKGALKERQISSHLGALSHFPSLCIHSLQANLSLWDSAACCADSGVRPSRLNCHVIISTPALPLRLGLSVKWACQLLLL